MSETNGDFYKGQISGLKFALERYKEWSWNPNGWTFEEVLWFHIDRLSKESKESVNSNDNI